MSSTLVAASRPPIRLKLRSLLVVTSMLGLTLGVVTPVLAATTITLVSGAGNGAFETPDPNVTYAIPSIPASGAAVIVAPHGVYASITGARWINTTGSTNDDQASGRTADYSIPFSLPAGFSAPAITVQVLTDNAGTVFLNGVQIGQQPQIDTSANFNTISTFTNDASVNFHAGSNTLTIRNLDFGSSNAVDFRADVTYTENAPAPTANPTRTPAPNANGWSKTDVTVAWNWTDAGSGIDPADCTTTSTTSGEFGANGQTLAASCTNLAGATGHAELTIFNVDQTPPTITAAAASSPNVGSVTVQFTCTDALSGIPAGACPPDQVLDAEGISTSTPETVTDAAGNTSEPSNVITISIDTTPPTIVAAPTTLPDGADGWYTSDVVIHFTCSDGGSGIPANACPADEILSAEGTAVASTARTVTDAAGITSAPSNVVTVKIDKTGPELDPSVSPSPVKLHGSASATAGGTDEVSGVVSQSCDVIDTDSVGVRTVECTATNDAGLTTSASVPYRVIYRFDGFLQPINDTAHTLTCGSPCPASTFKGRSTVPVKFELKDADGTIVESITAPLWITPQKGGPTSSQVDETVVSDPATTDSEYRLDGSQYHYNWSTKGFATGLFWRIGVLLDDGQTYYVNIALR